MASVRIDDDCQDAATSMNAFILEDELMTDNLEPMALTQQGISSNVSKISDQVPSHLVNLRSLFSQIEKEFEVLFLENVRLKSQLNSKDPSNSPVSRVWPDESRSESGTDSPHEGFAFQRGVLSEHSPLSEKHSETGEVAAYAPDLSNRRLQPQLSFEELNKIMNARWDERNEKTVSPARAQTPPKIVSGGSLKQKGAQTIKPTTSTESPTGVLQAAASSRPSASAAGLGGKESIGEKIKSRGLKFMSSAVGRFKDSSIAVTRVFRQGNDEEAVEWKTVGQLKGHTDGVWSLAASAWEGRGECLLASASADKSAKIWSAANYQELFTLSGHKGSVNSAKFHRSERVICTASGDRMWKLPAADAVSSEKDEGRRIDARRLSLKASLTLWGHSDVVSSAAWIALSDSVATSSWDKTVKIFDSSGASSKPLRTLVGHDGPLTSIASSPDGHLLLSSSRDCTARLWDARISPQLVHVFQGHSNTVTSVQLSHDGNLAVTASDDCTVRLWDLKARQTPLMMVKCGRNSVKSINFAQKSGMISAVLSNGTARVYNIEGVKVGILKVSADETSARGKNFKYLACTTWSCDEDAIFTAGFDPGHIDCWKMPM
eukprot:260522-Hanusia_phi.AAC.1